MKIKALIICFSFLTMLSCKKENNSVLVGTWKGKKIQETFEKGVLIKRYEDAITLELKDKNVGTFKEFSTDDIVHWYLDNINDKIFISILSEDPVFGRQFTDILFDIKTNDLDKQVWEREELLTTNLSTNAQKRVVDRWELKKM